MDFRRKTLMIIATLLPTLFLSLQAQAISSAISPVTRKMLSEVCAKSENPGSCVVTLSRNNRVSSATSIASVAKIALSAVRKESLAAQRIIRVALQSNPGKGGEEALRSCLTYFGDTIKQLVIRNGDLEAGEATLNVHYALDSIVSCETAMARGKVNIPAVKNRIHKWTDMFNVAYFAVTEAENAASGGM